MGLKIDKFTWIVIGVVLLLLIGAVVTVNLNRGQNSALTYVTEDSPTTPVHNAFVALQKGDMATARQQYSKSVLKDIEDNKTYAPFSQGSYVNDRTARRLRIINSQIDPNDAKRATVTVAIDQYSSGGGLFNGGNTYSYQRTIQVIREANAWKIDAPEFFNY